MKYPIYNRLARWALFTIDGILKACPKRLYVAHHPQKILLCNTAHLGDVILTTSLLPVLKRNYPDAKIGVLVGSGSFPLLENHPLVDRVHLLDHWKINRTHTPLLKKIRHYYTMRRQVVAELKEAKYDVALDCSFHFPNMAPVLWSAQIPMRIGFTSAGFGSLFTHSYPWNARENRSAVESYFSLLGALQISDRQGLKPNLPHTPTQKENYIVIHMGSGNAQKNWPLEKWKILAKRLVDEGERLYFTGMGEQENRDIEAVIQGLPRALNLCNQLSWGQFTHTIQKAALLIGVDTSAGHVAAAVDTPSVLIYPGIHPDKLWKPFSSTTLTITHATPCSPCFVGCSQMTCIREVTVEAIYSCIRRVTTSSRVPSNIWIE